MSVFTESDYLALSLSHLVGLVATLYFIVVAVMYISTRLCYDKVWGSKEVPTIKGNRTLVVTAHPDDECMFFGPAIMNLLRKGPVYLLCFSCGNHKGEGKRRKAELWKSCQVLGIPAENVTLMLHDKLKDDPNAKWPVLHLASYIRNHVISHEITTLLTFDKYGISGHNNHISIYHSVLDLFERNLLPLYCRVFTLTSVNVCRKYLLGLFDVPTCYYFNKYVCIADGRARGKIVKAMECHVSQMLWFRRLYVIFSRYMLINTFKEVTRRSIRFKYD